MNPYIAAEPAQPTSVEITLGDTVYRLEPTLLAMRAVNRIGGGFAGTFRLLRDFDADAFVAIVVAGVGATGSAIKEIEHAVYAHGIEPLAAPLTRFVSICLLGGRDPDAPRPGADGAEPGKP